MPQRGLLIMEESSSLCPRIAPTFATPSRYLCDPERIPEKGKGMHLWWIVLGISLSDAAVWGLRNCCQSLPLHLPKPLNCSTNLSSPLAQFMEQPGLHMIARSFGTG